MVPATSHSQNSGGQPPTLFLIEDDLVDQLAFQRALSKREVKYSLVISDSAEQALERLNDSQLASKPIIFIVDLNMPGVGGLGFLNSLRERRDLNKSIVFVLSSSDDRSDIDSAYEKHVAGYIVKSKAGTDMEKLFSLLEDYENLVELPFPSVEADSAAPRPTLESS